MKKVIVTGGAGFIGSHLAEELAKRGYHVTILDDLSTGKLANIEELLAKKVASFVKGSITNLTMLSQLFRNAEFVFHQAAIPSVPRSLDNPQATHEANVTGTLNVLLTARDNEVNRVIYASSSSVYGETQTLPKKEDMSPSPQSPYAVSKLAGEYYCRVFHQIYGLPTVCLRYFNVYGPKQDPDSQYAAVIPRFITMLSQGNSPIIYGDGEQTRDFTFVADVVEANILAAESGASGIFNIGRGKSVTLNRLTELVADIVGNNITPIHEEPRPGDVRHSLADTARARTFGYAPKYDIEEGLKETIRRFKNDR